MGRQARLKKERREARIKAGLARAPRGEKIGDLDDLTDDAELLLKQMHNHVKNRIKLTVLQVEKQQYGTEEDTKHILSGVSCGDCKANKGCCFMSVSALMFEGLPIVRRLKQTGRDTPELRAKLHSLGDAMEDATKGDWFAKQTPCAFLDDDQGCSIYDVRPSACRHHVVFSPPELCSPPETKNTLQFGSDQELTTAFNWNVAIGESFFGMQDLQKQGVVLVGSLPKVVARMLDIFDNEDFCKAMRESDWPTVDNPPNMG